MGLSDRSYMAARPMRAVSWTGGIVAVNVAIFFLWQVRDLQGLLFIHATVSASGVVEHGRIHTLLTSAFSHMDIKHLVFNMLFLWWFGRDLEDWYGPVRFAVLLIFSALVASLAHVGLHLALGQPWRPALGASGVVMGFMVVYAFLFPDRQMYLWGAIPIRMRWLAPLYVLMDLFGVFHRGSRIGHAAHLGGALAGLVFYAWDPETLSQATGTFWNRIRVIFGPRQRPGSRLFSQAELRNDRTDPDADRADQLLAKIFQQGIGALTDEERRFLDEYSRRRRRPD